MTEKKIIGNLATDEQIAAAVKKNQSSRDQFPVNAPDPLATQVELAEKLEDFRPDPPLTPEVAYEELLALIETALKMINTSELNKTAQGILSQYSQAAFRGQAISATWNLFLRFNLSDKLYRLQFGEIGNDGLPGEQSIGLETVKKKLANEFVAKLTAAGYSQ